MLWGTEQWGNMQGKQPCRPQGQCRRRARRCSRGWSRDSHATCGEVACKASCSMEVHNGTDTDPAVHQGLHATPLDIPWRTLQLKEIPWWNTLHAGAAACWQDQVFCSSHDPVDDPCWSNLFQKGCTPWEGTQPEQFLNCSRWEGPTLEQLMKDCLLWECPHAEVGEQDEKEGLTKTNCYKLHNQLSTLSCGTWGRGGRDRRVRKKGMNLSLERKGVCRKVALVLILLMISLVCF